MYKKYKTLESFSINKHHTTTSYKIFCGKQSSSADSYVTYLDPITMLRNIEGKKRTIFKLEYLLLRLISQRDSKLKLHLRSKFDDLPFIDKKKMADFLVDLIKQKNKYMNSQVCTM